LDKKYSVYKIHVPKRLEKPGKIPVVKAKLKIKFPKIAK